MKYQNKSFEHFLWMNNMNINFKELKRDIKYYDFVLTKEFLLELLDSIDTMIGKASDEAYEQGYDDGERDH